MAGQRVESVRGLAGRIQDLWGLVEFWMPCARHAPRGLTRRVMSCHRGEKGSSLDHQQ